MMLIPCPHCGPRGSAEFRYAGEATARPDPGSADPVAWRTYLYFRRNPAGWTTETWFHRMGCRKYFQVERNTVSNQVRAHGGPPAGDPAGGDPAGGRWAGDGQARNRES